MFLPLRNVILPIIAVIFMASALIACRAYNPQQLHLGMTPMDVQRAWGNPYKTRTTHTRKGERLFWYYRTQKKGGDKYTVVFTNGRLSRVTEVRQQRGY